MIITIYWPDARAVPWNTKPKVLKYGPSLHPARWSANQIARKQDRMSSHIITLCINFELSIECIWMNIKNHFCLSRHLISAIACTQHSETGNIYIFVIVNIQSFTFQIFGVVGPFGRKPRLLLVRWDLTFKQILITKPKKSSSTQSEL